MPHTSSHPPHVPFIDSVRHELYLNMPDTERYLSTLSGAGLIGFGLTQPSWKRWLYIALGGVLLKRGLTGHCDLYEQLHIDTRHPAPKSSEEGNTKTRLESSIDIRCPAQGLYTFWRQLNHLPRVLRHVVAVEPRDGVHSHWVVQGPLGQQFEWDARIINDHENELIAWETLPGASVPNAGSIRFEELSSGITRVKVAVEFQAPGRSVSLIAAKLLGDSPQKELEEDLAAFKDFAERELTPASHSLN